MQREESEKRVHGNWLLFGAMEITKGGPQELLKNPEAAN